MLPPSSVINDASTAALHFLLRYLYFRGGTDTTPVSTLVPVTSACSDWLRALVTCRRSHGFRFRFTEESPSGKLLRNWRGKMMSHASWTLITWWCNTWWHPIGIWAIWVIMVGCPIYLRIPVLSFWRFFGVCVGPRPM